MEENTIDNPAENSEDIVVDTEALENEAEAVDDDQDGDESNDIDANDQETQESEESDPVINWDEEPSTETAPELANEKVRTSLQGEALEQYDSQLVGFKKYRETVEAKDAQVQYLMNPANTSQSNQWLAEQSHGLRLIDATNPDAFAASLREVVAELAEKDSAFRVVDPEELAYIDPEVAKIKREMAELRKQTQTAEAIRQADLWKATKGNQLKTLVEQQLGVKVDADLLYKVYQSGQRPTKASEILDAIGRTDFDAYKRLVSEKQSATKKAPPAASAKSNRSGGAQVSMDDAINDPAKWRELALSKRQR